MKASPRKLWLKLLPLLTLLLASGSAPAATGGAAYAWGAGLTGRLGNNATTDSLVPVAVDVSGVLAGKTVTAIAAASPTVSR